MEVKNHELIRTVSDCTSAAVGDGVEPDERMHKNRRERFAQTHAGTRIPALVRFDDAMIARFFRRFFDADNQQNRNDRDNQRRNAKKPMPIALRDDKCANRKSG